MSERADEGSERQAMTMAPELGEIRVSVESDTDIVTARQKGRALASQLGFSSGDLTIITTAISELARNIVLYAKRGEIILTPVNRGSQCGLTITARDEGEGIPDIRQALQDGYSTSGRLGVGLPGVRRLMDEFEIASEVGKGTVVTVKKWKRVSGAGDGVWQPGRRVVSSASRAPWISV